MGLGLGLGLGSGLGFGFGFGFGLGLEESVLLQVPLAAVLVHDALREARSTK